MADARDVARLLIRLAARDAEGEPMTAMRLQKLLYYCQGWFLAWYGRPLFADPVEAWKHGPVVPAVYDLFRGYGGLPLPDAGDPTGLAAGERAAVERVWSHYARYSARGLRDLTHAERPWAAHYAPDGAGRCDAVIPAAELAAFFGDEYRRRTGEEPGAAGDDGGPGVPLDEFLQTAGW